MDMQYELDKQQRHFREGATRSAAARRHALRSLADAIRKHEDDLLAALEADLGKPRLEAYASELGFVLRDVRHAERNLERWMSGRRAKLPRMVRPGRAETVPEPLGVVLILGPWNYPFQLVFSPLVAAIAAGNCACIKPSEHAPATAAAIDRLCRDAFDPGHVIVVTGGADVSEALTAMPFDHIFFTGSSAIGRKVAGAAARNLVPVTLELGGKSPCVVCSDAKLDVAARRILWGKGINTGQTCVAPDYVLVEKECAETFLQELKTALDELFPAGAGERGRIVSEAHYRRLVELMEEGTLFAGGARDEKRLTMTTALLTGVKPGARLLQEEIFGPLLPVIEVASRNDAIDEIARRPKPLAAYLFTEDAETVDAFVREVAAGTICVNDTVVQIMPAELPFGGVGESGYGRYRGRAGFDTFSNLKAVMRRPTRPDPKYRYKPGRISLTLFRRIIAWMLR